MGTRQKPSAVYELLVREHPDVCLEILTVFGRCPTPSRGSSSGDWLGVWQWWDDVSRYLTQRYGINDQSLPLAIHISGQIAKELGVKRDECTI